MSIAIYISDSRVMVVRGKRNATTPTVEGIWEVPFSEEIMRNGVITNEKVFVRELREFWEENGFPTKDVNLVMNNKMTTTSVIEVPEAKDKDIYEIVKRRLSDYEQGNTVCIWDTIERADKKLNKKLKAQEKASGKKLRKNKKKTKTMTPEEREFFGEELEQEEETTTQGSLNRLLCSKIELEDLDHLLTLLRYAGLQIVSVEDYLLNFVKLMTESKEIGDGTSIVQVLQKNRIDSLLFYRGVYYYSTTSKLFEKPGSIGFAIQMARSVSGILQFMKTQSMEYDSMNVFLMGLDPEDIINCTDSILQMDSSINVDEISGEELVHNVSGRSVDTDIRCCTGLMQMSKNADFYPALKKELKRVKGADPAAKYVVPVGALTAVCLVITIILGIMNLRIQGKIDKAKAYNESVSVLSEQYDEALQSAIDYEKQSNVLTKVQENVATYPKADESVERVIRKAAKKYVNVEIKSYDASTGLYTVFTTAKDVKNIHKYVDNLRKKDIFVEVDYTGYHLDEDSKLWNVNVQCYLSETAGKE